MDVERTIYVVGEMSALGLPELIQDPLACGARPVAELAAPRRTLPLEERGDGEGRRHERRRVRGIGGPAVLGGEGIAPAKRPCTAVGAEEFEGLDAERPNPLLAGLGSDPQPCRREQRQPLSEPRIAGAVQAADVDRSARVRVENDEPPAARGDERTGPVPPQPVKRIWPFPPLSPRLLDEASRHTRAGQRRPARAASSAAGG